MDLTNLYTCVSVVKFDINKFKLYVKEKRKKVRNRDEALQDILFNLIKAYKMASDQIFNNWLIGKKEKYEEGAKVTSDSLMLDVLDYYQALKIEAKWMTSSPEDKQIEALPS